MATRFHVAIAVVVALAGPAVAQAQITPNQPSAAQSGGSEARTVGRKGARQTSISGSLSAFQTTTIEPIINSRGQLMGFDETTGWNTNLTMFLEQAWFLNDRTALRMGSLISGNTQSTTTGLTGGLRFYLSPRGTASLYAVGNGGFSSTKSGDDTRGSGLAEGGLGFETVAGTNAAYFVEGLAQRLFADGGGTNQYLLVVGIRIVY